MTDWLRDSENDFADLPTDDNNVKLLWEDSKVKLEKWGNEFGSVVNALWSELSGAQINNGWTMGKGTAAFSEAGNVLDVSDGGAGEYGVWAQHNQSFVDCDILIKVDPTDENEPEAYVAQTGLWLWVDNENWVRIVRSARAPNLGVQVSSKVNNVFTEHDTAPGDDHLIAYFRIKRITGVGTQTFYFYYGWLGTDSTPTWDYSNSYVIYDAVTFNEHAVLYPIWEVYSQASADTYLPEMIFIRQFETDIAEQRWWSDSPACNIIDSDAGAVEYVIDLGVDKAFVGTGFASTLTNSVKFRMGYGTASDRASATFFGGLLAAAALDALVAAGSFDGYRYIFLKAYFESTGATQCTLSDVTISGAAGDVEHTFTQSATEVKEDSSAMKVVGFAGPQLDEYYAQKIDVIEGEGYECTGFIYATVAPTAGYFYIQAYDVTNAAEVAIAKASSATSSWRMLELAFDVPATCTDLEIRVGGNVQGGTAYFDAIDCFRARAKDYS